MKELRRFKAKAAEIHALQGVLAVLDWDQQVNMPPAGAAGRARQIGSVSALAHEKFTDKEFGDLLDSLADYQQSLDVDCDDYCLLWKLRRDYDKQKRVSSKFVGEFSHLTAQAHNLWEEARRNDDFSLFAPALERIFAMRREYAGFFSDSFACAYDALLDDFEPEMSSAEINALFAEIKDFQVDLLQQIAGKPQIDDSCLRGNYDVKIQDKLCRHAAEMIGYDFSRGRLDTAAHPFTTTFALDDVRITTRFYADYFPAGFFSTVHEAGHAIYEQNIAKELDLYPTGTGASLAVHESQSRFWENIIGRSHAFWQRFFPQVQKSFAPGLRSTTLTGFYRALNKVEPGLIRVDADEASYNLHIMLRMELEQKLIEGELEVKDLPHIWREKMREYLGVEVKNDADGVLQDVHWSAGIIGYFPTYAIGNLISAQIMDVMNHKLGNLEELIAAGDFAKIRGFLAQNLHRHGAKYAPGRLLKKAFGIELSSKPYMKYLREKYTRIYDL